MHKLDLLLLIILLTSIMYSQEQQKLSLMPYPYKVDMMDGKFRINKSFGISIKGDSKSRVFNYAKNVSERLKNRTGIFFYENIVFFNNTSDTISLNIIFDRVGKLSVGEDESYNMIINSNGIKISAITDIGALRGLETFLQLVKGDEEGYYLPFIKIEDKPRFVWRGLMIDVSRHFMPIEVIKRNIDALAMVKMNVLHLHLSDNQGVRVESKIFPQIQEKASDGLFFTQQQLKDIVAYADAHGIRVIPEFDIPWHSTAWFMAFPELASAPVPNIERNWGVFDPVFNPTKQDTYDFFDKFIGEMAAIFPDEYFHIGGDEGTDKEWLGNPEIKDFMLRNNTPNVSELHKYFNDKILAIITKHGKKMIGWDEILYPGVSKNILIQSWRGQKALVQAAKNGYKGILSNGYYIDLMQPTEFHYLNDPIPDTSNISSFEADNIMGGEATQWAELVTQENIDSRIWPRTAPIAERFWSPQNVRDVEFMYRRIPIISAQLEEVGLTHIKNQDMMLRRIMGVQGNNLTDNDLAFLINFIEPVKEYKRHSQGVKYTQFSPYTRIVDAAVADPIYTRLLKYDMMKNPFDKKIKDIFTRLNQLEKSFLNLANTSPILNELKPLVHNLTLISAEYLKISEIKSSGGSLSERDKTEIKKTLDAAKKPYGQVEINIISDIEKLIK